jgi:peptide/nickel transport system permease protein
MAYYIARRIAAIGLILVVISMLIFAITQALPGNVAHMIAGQFATPDVIAAIEAKLGLHDPLVVQYWRWATRILSGDLGQSLIMERPIGPMLRSALANSAILAAVSFAVVAIAGVCLGIVAALRHDTALDHGIAVATLLGISIPDFFWGIVLILVFAGYLHWLPSGGAGDAASGGVSISHLVLPAATLTFALIAHVTRMTRSSMLETLSSQYVRYARAKGLPERVVVMRHALRNALLPTITVLAIDIGLLIGGIVVVEMVFSFPGLGRLLLFAIERHDLPLIQATILVVAAVYCFANLAADLLYAYFNPRIRYGRPRG